MVPKTLRLIAALAVVGLARPAAAETTEIYPLEKVRRGQTGYGLTTFKGTTPEQFTFEVVSVVKNFLPKIDIILVKSDDPKLQVSGFWRGMSGSPLFIEGKLACAFSYGWRFNKLALGGCTPLKYMKREGFAPTKYDFRDGSVIRVKGRGRPAVKRTGRPSAAARPAPSRPASAGASSAAAASIREWLEVAPDRTVDSALAAVDSARKPWFLRAPLPARPAVPAEDSGLVASAVPLSLAGYSAPAFEHVKQLMAGYPVEPLRAGGTGRPGEGPREFSLGGTIAVEIVRGDMSIAATGTVSYVEGARVLGFGHPLFQAGEIYAPVSVAEVHTVIPSAMSAFVMASPMRELGSLVQDRASTIMADTELKSPMIPVDIYVEVTKGRGPIDKGEFHVEVVNNKFLTGPFAGISAMSALSHYLPDRDPATVQIESVVHLRGHKPLRFVDYLYDETGAGSAIGGARGLRALMPLVHNPFAPVAIERVELRAKIAYEVNFGQIESLRLPTAELEPGKRARVEVTMTTYDGAKIVERVPFDVPASLAGSIVKLEVSSGADAGVDAAPPETLDDLLAALRKLLPGNVLAVTLYTADQGVAMRGKLVRDLPASAIDKLHPSTATGVVATHQPIARSVSPSSRVITGSQSILVKIADAE